MTAIAEKPTGKTLLALVAEEMEKVGRDAMGVKSHILGMTCCRRPIRQGQTCTKCGLSCH